MAVADGLGLRIRTAGASGRSRSGERGGRCTSTATVTCSGRCSTGPRRCFRAPPSCPPARRRATPCSSRAPISRIPRRPWVMQSLFLAAIGDARDRGAAALETFSYAYREGETMYERFLVHRTVFPRDFLADLGFRTLRSAGRVELVRLDFGGLQPVLAGSRASVLAPGCARSSRPRSRCPCRGPRRRAREASASTSSAIWIALSAAPLRRLSPTRSRHRPFSAPGSAPDAADEHVVLPRRLPGRGARRPGACPVQPSSSSRRRRRERLLRSRSTPPRRGRRHRHAHAARADRQLRELQDLPSLVAQLRLLVELDRRRSPSPCREIVLCAGASRAPSLRRRPRPTPTGTSPRALVRARLRRGAA